MNSSSFAYAREKLEEFDFSSFDLDEIIQILEQDFTSTLPDLCSLYGKEANEILGPEKNIQQQAKMALTKIHFETELSLILHLEKSAKITAQKHHFNRPKASYFLILGFYFLESFKESAALEAFIKGLLCYHIDKFEIGFQNNTPEAVQGKQKACDDLLLNLKKIMRQQA